MQFSVFFSNSDFPQTLVLQSVLGRGKSTVYHAKGVAVEGDFALKVFSKNPSGYSHYRKEKTTISRLQHPNIIQYVPVIEHTLPYEFVATEYTSHGDFFDFITRGGMKSEKIARSYFHQLIEGIQYLHSQNTAHLDLKVDNLLLGNDFSLKIIDFDQAQDADDTKLETGGTYGYRAPEVLKMDCRNLKAADMYAVGVILYIFRTGEMPFVEEVNEEVKLTAQYATFKEMKETFWRGKEKELELPFSQEFQELINRLFEENPEYRYTIADVKRSSWYTGEVYNKEELLKEVMTTFEGAEAN